MNGVTAKTAAKNIHYAKNTFQNGNIACSPGSSFVSVQPEGTCYYSGTTKNIVKCTFNTTPYKECYPLTDIINCGDGGTPIIQEPLALCNTNGGSCIATREPNMVCGYEFN